MSVINDHAVCCGFSTTDKLEIVGGKMKRERSMTWNYCQVLLKCTFLLKLLNHSFYVCSIKEHERWNILSFVAVLLEI
jgi:hypothetical protein